MGTTPERTLCIDSPHLSVATFNRRFTYKADSYENWTILPDHGNVKGDCEDYALSIIHLTEGSMRRFWWSLLVRRNVIYRATLPDTGAAHAVLYRRGTGYVDNTQPHWSPTPGPRVDLSIPYPVVVVALKMLLKPLFKALYERRSR